MLGLDLEAWGATHYIASLSELPYLLSSIAASGDECTRYRRVVKILSKTLHAEMHLFQQFRIRVRVRVRVRVG